MSGAWIQTKPVSAIAYGGHARAREQMLAWHGSEGKVFFLMSNNDQCGRVECSDSIYFNWVYTGPKAILQ